MSIGVNLSGAEFGSGHEYGHDYIYPSNASLDYYASQGVDLIRLPVKWERVQTTLEGPLNAAEVARIAAVLDAAAECGIDVIVDIHNYGRFGGNAIGSAAVPVEAFADLWGQLASTFGAHPALGGYGLMNEPHDMGGPAVWPTAAQAAIDAIRAVDTAHTVIVAGDGWSNASTWSTANAALMVKDPADNLLYEAHAYFDKNGSGTYQGTYDQEGANPLTGIERLQPFLDWLDENGARGFIGEFGVPRDDPRWLTVLDNFVEALQQTGISGTMWGGGPWWGNYKLSIEPWGGVDSAQMKVLADQLLTDRVAGGIRYGTAVADVLAGSSGADRLFGRTGDDSLSSGEGNDRLSGQRGNDVLDGGAGADEMFGGKGNDVFYVDNLGDKTVESAGEGRDCVVSSVAATLAANIEDLTLAGTASINGTGNALDNAVTGNAGANILAGLDGADILDGREGDDMLDAGVGNDTLIGQSGSDLLKGGSGNDIVDGGEGDDRLLGDAHDDRLEGGSGDDWLDGGTGRDILRGGEGNDTYVVDSITDTLFDAGGVDLVIASCGFTLGSGFESLRLVGSATVSLKGIGNSADNVLEGSAGANTLSGLEGRDLLKGLAGADILLGGAGSDTLDGGEGNDILDGGAGGDLLIGGLGADRFVFANIADVALDEILDFALGDRIDLSKIDARAGTSANDAFRFVGSADFSGRLGELRAVHSGDDTIISGDVNGDKIADFSLTLAGYLALGGTDFIL